MRGSTLRQPGTRIQCFEEDTVEFIHAGKGRSPGPQTRLEAGAAEPFDDCRVARKDMDRDGPGRVLPLTIAGG